MPTENERKYVLSKPEAVRALWADWSEIRQGYLPGDARIRRRTDGGISRDSFTYKLATANRLIEIETAIEDPRDFDDLWPKSMRRIRKLRHTTTDRHGLQWDVDLLLRESGETYFAIAECEMPEGMDAPPEILPELAPHVLFEVPRARQDEFVNSRLADPAYAAALKF